MAGPGGKESLLQELISFHRQAEDAIARRVAKICSTACRECGGDCCREEICVEIEKSYFLSRVAVKRRGQEEKAEWFDEQGCLFEYGRPLFCRGFFCDELLNSAADEIKPVREFINDWKLVYKNFIGSRSLLATEPDKINPGRLQKTLRKAEKFRHKWLAGAGRP